MSAGKLTSRQNLHAYLSRKSSRAIDANDDGEFNEEPVLERYSSQQLMFLGGLSDSESDNSAETESETESDSASSSAYEIDSASATKSENAENDARPHSVTIKI